MAGPRCPGSWTATRTWCSPDDRAANSAARSSGEPYTSGGIRTTVAATRAASDEPEHNSLGAFGDLASLAHCALVMLGEGWCACNCACCSPRRLPAGSRSVSAFANEPGPDVFLAPMMESAHALIAGRQVRAAIEAAVGPLR